MNTEKWKAESETAETAMPPALVFAFSLSVFRLFKLPV
jgi:hypothetical protein